MSIRTLTSRDTATIERMGTTQDAEGGTVRAYSTANRTGTLPKIIKGRVQSLNHENRVKYGVEGSEEAFIWYFHKNPYLTVQDRLVWTDISKVVHNAPVFHPSRDADDQGRLFSAIVVEETVNES